MQKKILAVLIATCVCALTQSQGQLLQPQVKTLVRLPEQGGHWTVQFKPRTPSHPHAQGASGANGGQTPVAPPVTLNSIDVVSTKDVRRDRIQWSNGSTTDVWKIKGEWFFPFSKDEVMTMNTFPGAHIYTGWKAFDNDELQQIAKSGTGTLTEYRQMPVIYYGSVRTEQAVNFLTSIESIIRAPKTPAPPPTKTALGLFVDPQTLYPIVYRESTGDYSFTNITEGPQTLEVPQIFAHVARRSQDSRYIPKPPNHP